MLGPTAWAAHRRLKQHLLCQCTAPDPALGTHHRKEKRGLLESIPDAIVGWFPALGSPEIFRRVLWTFFALVIYRLGAFIPLYGVDLSKLPTLGSQRLMESEVLRGNMIGLPCNIFMLGLTPIFGASMGMNVFIVFPSLLGKPEGLVGTGKEGLALIKVITRFITLAVALVMGTVQAFNLRPYTSDPSGFITGTMLTLACGTMVLTHIADENEGRGLGSGLSLFIAISVLVQQTKILAIVLKAVVLGLLPVWKAATASVGIVMLMAAAIFVSHIEKKYELISYKINAAAPRRKRRRGADDRNFLPIRISPSGTLPLMMGPMYLQLAANAWIVFGAKARMAVMDLLFRPSVLPFSMAAMAFVQIAVNWTGGKTAADIGTWMQSADVGIVRDPPLVPGHPTTRFIARQQSLIHFLGGLLVAVLACLAFGWDALCLQHLGMNVGSVNMLVLTGFITTVYRQVSSLSELPKLTRRVRAEQQLLQGFKE